VALRHPGRVAVVSEPVDATRVPDEVDQQARTVMSAFHHFPAHLASEILGDCVRKRRPIFILEAFPRKISRMLSVLPAMTVAVLANPFLTRRDQVAKIVFTYLLPVIPLAGLWDALVSVFRVHSEAELRAMVAPFGGDYSWEYREIPFFPFGRLAVFFGIPAVRETPSPRLEARPAALVS